MALQIEYRDVAKLVPYAQNARLHSTLQVTQISKSIKEFGFNSPVLIDPKGNLIAGHGRVLAAKLLRMKQVPCVVLGHLNDQQRRAYVIADNKIAMNSTYDMEVLELEMKGIEGDGFDLEGLGLTFEFSAGADMDADVADAAEAGDNSAIASGESSAQSAPKNEYPIYISLGRKDFERWKILRGIDSDNEAFLKIINAESDK